MRPVVRQRRVELFARRRQPAELADRLVPGESADAVRVVGIAGAVDAERGDVLPGVPRPVAGSVAVARLARAEPLPHGREPEIPAPVVDVPALERVPRGDRLLSPETCETLGAGIFRNGPPRTGPCPHPTPPLARLLHVEVQGAANLAA